MPESVQAQSNEQVVNIRIPGFGRTRLFLKETNRAFPAFFLSEDKKVADSNRPKFFIGKSKNFKGQQSLVAYQINNQALKVILPIKEKNFAFLELAIEDKKTRMRRIPESFDLCNTEIKQLRSIQQKQNVSNNSITLPISLAADKSWYEKFGESSNAIMQAMLLIAEKIYQEDLKIKFRIKEINTYLYDVLEPNQFELESYQNFLSKQNTKTNLHHLFTTKQITAGASGIADFSSFCAKKHSVGITRFSDLSMTPLTLAHEIAHQLGAGHAELFPASLMSPIIRANTELNFSKQSKEQINSYLDQQQSCLNSNFGSGAENLELESAMNKGNYLTILAHNTKPNCSLKIQAKMPKAKRFRKLGKFPVTSYKMGFILELKSFKGKITFKASQHCSDGEVISSKPAKVKGSGRKYRNPGNLFRKLKKAISSYYH